MRLIRKRQSDSLLLICLGVLVYLSSVTTFKTPTCKVKTGDIRTPCFVFEQNKDCCSLESILFNNDSVVTHNITAKGNRPTRSPQKPYMPTTLPRYISIPFSPQQTNEFVLMLHMPKAPEMCWNVQLTKEDDQHYDNAEIKVILRTDFAKGWTAITYSSDDCESIFNETDNETTSCECELLRKSDSFFKATSPRKELEFDISRNLSSSTELLVNVLSADHSITCNGTVNSGIVDPPVQYRWTNISNPWRRNVSIGYHCLTISLLKDANCVVYTETVYIEDLVLEQRPAMKLVRTQLPYIVMAAAISSMCVAALFFGIFKHRGKFKFNRIVVADSQAVKTPLLAGKIKILLIYSRDSEEFVKLVASFRNLLELRYDNMEVFDPFDESQNETISRNSELWLTELLYSPHVKVIFIASEGAILRLDAETNGNQLVANEPNCLDILFTSALNHLRNPLLSSDYRRIFLVGFDGLPSDLPTDITPFRCFMLLEHFDSFLIEITGIHSVSTIHSEDYNRKYSQGVEEFRSAQNEVMQIRARNPNYVHQRWLVIKP